MRRTLSVLSWNLHDLPWILGPHHSQRVRRVTAKAIELSPDIITFQEVWLKSDEQPMVQALQQRGYSVLESPAGRLGLKESGLLTLVQTRSGWTIETGWRERFRASAATIKFWEGDGLSRKGMQVLRLNHPQYGPLVLINTHLQSQYRNKYEQVRRRQLAQLSEVAEIHAADGVPLLVCGDFNTDPSETGIYPLLSDSPWLDLTRPFRDRCGGCKTHYKTRHEMDAWIDYVIARQDPRLRIAMDLRLESNVHKDTPYSDHQGLFGTITIDDVQSEATFAPLVGLCLASGSTTRRQWMQRALISAFASCLTCE